MAQKFKHNIKCVCVYMYIYIVYTHFVRQILMLIIVNTGFGIEQIRCNDLRNYV